MGRHNYWADEEIINWASYYVASPFNTVLTVEADLGVSHSTVWWCFVHRLIDIDKRLYSRVMSQMDTHSGRRIRRIP